MSTEWIYGPISTVLRPLEDQLMGIIVQHQSTARLLATSPPSCPIYTKGNRVTGASVSYVPRKSVSKLEELNLSRLANPADLGRQDMVEDPPVSHV